MTDKACKKCSSTSLDRDGDCLACGESREGYDDHDLVCDNCDGTGYLFPWGDDTGFVCVERCDQCLNFQSDDQAAEELAGKLLRLDEGYCVATITLPDMLWEEAGSCRSVVMKMQHSADTPHYLEPINWSDGVQLAKRLRGQMVQPGACPSCRTTELTVMLGSGGEVDYLVCQDCDWTGKPAELFKVKNK